jgi:hypothetical protein
MGDKMEELKGKKFSSKTTSREMYVWQEER